MNKSKNPIKPGDKFGEWTVIKKGLKPSHSLCECSCGIRREVADSSLRLGKSLSCGHLKVKKRKEQSYKESDKKTIGKRFGKLVVIKRANNEGPSRYVCQCDCGNKTTVSLGALTSGGVLSCGCIKKETSRKSMDKIKDLGYKKAKNLRVEGTALYNMTEKISKNSTTGYKGVSYNKRSKKYRAYLTIRGKQVNLGSYDTVEEAHQARLKGEEKYYEPILEKHKDKLEK